VVDRLFSTLSAMVLDLLKRFQTDAHRFVHRKIRKLVQGKAKKKPKKNGIKDETTANPQKKNVARQTSFAFNVFPRQPMVDNSNW
jgi:hypothetical protein